MKTAAVIDHSLRTQDFKKGVLKAGPAPIAASPTTTIVTSLTVAAAGTYIFWAKTHMSSADAGIVTCDLKAGGDFDEAEAYQLGTPPITIEMNVTHVFAAPGTVDLVCSSTADLTAAHFATVSGIQVANLARADG